MKKAASEYVFSRGNGIYCFRRAVPADLRDIVGKREWKISLRTRDKSIANARAAKMSLKIQNRINQLRGEANEDDPIDPLFPATDQQVVSALKAILARDRTVRIGRLDGRIENAIIDGKSAQDLLGKLTSELNAMEASTPLAMDKSELDRFLPQLMETTGREILSDAKLTSKLKRAFWNHEKQILETQIAQVRGDQVALDALSTLGQTRHDLQFLTELYIAQRGNNWSPKTRTKIENIFRVLLDILGSRTKISEVDREQARKFNQTLHQLPTHYSERKELRGLPAEKAAELGQKLGLPVLGYKSIKVYQSYAASVFEFAVNEDLIPKNPMKGLPVQTEFVDPPSKKPSAEAIQKIFSAPVFNGCKNDTQNWREPGPNLIRRGRYWVPIIALHSGMRVGEICSLRARDIQTQFGVDFFNISKASQGRLKTKSAERIVPIHKQLENLGFLEWIKSSNFSEDDFLFSELPANSKGNRGDAFSKWFGALRKSMHVQEPGSSMHGFRHLFVDLLRETNPREEHLRRIMGWAQKDMLGVYGDGKVVKLLNDYIQKIDFSDYDISHLVR